VPERLSYESYGRYAMGKLTALDVQRVDAVDKPATRRRFILIKQSDATAGGDSARGDAPAGTAGQDGAGVDVQAVTQAARAVLMEFQGVDLTPEQASALMALAEACGLADLAPKAEEVANAETAPRAGERAVSVERAADSPAGQIDAELVAAIARAVTEAVVAQLSASTSPAPGPTETAGTVEVARVARVAGPGRATGTGTGTGMGTVPVARSAPPPSRQAARSGEEPPRLGHGLFADVIFGQ
jgi:hypothetical protein